MANILKPKFSNTASAVPTVSNLEDGEFAINVVDKIIYKRVGTNIIAVANWVDVGAVIHASTAKTTPVDADTFGLIDSAAANALKKITWANFKAAIKSYYDSVVSVITNKDLTSTTNTFALVTTITSSGTLTPTGNGRENEAYAPAQAVALTIAAPSGTPANGNKLWISIRGTGTSSISWHAIFAPMSFTLPANQVANKTILAGFKYSSAEMRWQCQGVIVET